MRRCLRDRSLLLVHYGEGRAAHLAHLETCANCTARYRQLVQDLERIGHALERLPSTLPVRRPRPGRASWQRRVTLAATLAAGVAMVVSVGVWQWRGAQVLVQGQRTADETEILRFLAEASSGLSAPSEENLALPPVPYRADRDETALEEQDGSPGEVEGAWMPDGALDTDTWRGSEDAHT